MENHESKKIQSLVGRNKPKSTNNNIGSISPTDSFLLSLGIDRMG